jgi:beta-glucuronidase
MIHHQCGGVPYFVENGLPYPTAFQGQSYPRFHIGAPECFNLIGSPLEDFEGVLTIERCFDFPDERAPLQRLCFEGCFHSAEVWLNEVYLGRSCDPCLPFYFNVTDALNYGGSNKLRVEVDNRIGPFTLPPKQFEGHKPGWKLYSGIIGDVYIDSLPEIYCFKADIRTIGNEVICDLLFAQADGSVTHAQYQNAVETPKRWNPDSPHLHTLVIRTPYGAQTVKFGFRDVGTDSRSILIDGSPVILKGVCRHEEGAAHGHSMPPSEVAMELSLIKRLGGNLARLAHYPHSEHTYDLCDRVGLWVYTEIANYQAGLGIVQGLFGKSAELRKNRLSAAKLWRLLRSTRQLSAPEYVEAAKRSLIKLIERDRNHPSVLFWGVGNECFSYSRKGRKALLDLKKLVAMLDPTRPAVYAAFTVPGFTHHIEKALDLFDVVCVNEYYGWYYGSVGDAAGYWRKIAKRCPGKPLLLTETGSDSYLSDQASLYLQSRLIRDHWALVQEGLLSGMCVWVLKDFACPEYGDDLPVPGHNAKGLYTKEYHEKPAASELRALWSEPTDDAPHG